MRPATELADYVAGFVAAEGTFTRSGDPPSFTFAVGLGAVDRGSCEELLSFFGVGHIHVSPRRRPTYDDEVTFAVRSLRQHVAVVIPFMDQHLPASYKRIQYLAWREQVVDYWEHGMKRRRPCSVDGCDELRRAHGLCRHHLYERYGV